MTTPEALAALSYRLRILFKESGEPRVAVECLAIADDLDELVFSLTEQAREIERLKMLVFSPTGDRAGEEREMSKRYLGDGVYVDFDGFQIWLTAENGITATDRIALEPNVYRALVEYVESLKATS